MAQTELWLPIQGFEAYYTDWLSDNDGIRNLVGEALSEILGASSALPSSNAGGITPVTVVPGSGLQVVCGGTGQGVFCQGRVVDNCPSTALTVPSNATGSTRLDMVSIQYVQTPVNVVSRPTKNPSTGVITNQNMGQVNESISFTYTVGTTSLPSVPTGQVALAQVAVPNGASSITTGEITYLMPTVASILAALLTSYFTQLVHGGTATTSTFVLPAPTGLGGASVNVVVADITDFPAPSRILVSDSVGGNLAIMKVVSVTPGSGYTGTLACTTEQIISGTAGNTVSSGSIVVLAGVTEYYPIGSVQRVYSRLAASPQSNAYTLQLQLPAQGTWALYAEADGYLGQGRMAVSIAGATSSESGVGTNVAPPVSTGGYARADCSGQSQGGQLVTATCQFTAAYWQQGPDGAAAGTFRFTATRIL